jgi:hypothetical protein
MIDPKVKAFPVRVKTVTHRGLFGRVEYKPLLKIWQYTLKLIYPVTHRGTSMTEAEATLELKKLINTAADGNNKHVRSVE